ncbi:SIR2 family protein [Bacillus sp. ISL-35]|uniref:SIR2 family protein n=1 Tax=Bacillus sp. ISL-35 TaxID=2819122 RepID=UPI001BE9FBC2|nr:SIR2 family protein [Bacillus sp. ISL-35]MBT2677366.1 SIR2 family protein [Bacillus sp. ISL-35]MBT2702247.1 SIR2 family protein [Chryseobacterium sp. ISL-80]
MHDYIYNQINHSISFSKNEIQEFFSKESPDQVTTEELEGFHVHLTDIIKGTLYHDFFNSLTVNDNENVLSNIRDLLKKKTQTIRNDILNKYLQSENLHVLMSNGCSMYAGSKAINTNDKQEHTTLLEEFNFTKTVNNQTELESVIHDLARARPEQALDRLYEMVSYYRNVLQDETIHSQLEVLVEKFKRVFIKNFVLTVNYEQNHLHKTFLKKLVSRGSKVKKANIFTLNYDLLIEKTAEELGIHVNNGFVGFHNRSFNPSSFHLDTHIQYSDGGRTFTKGINLFKLHGSLSWIFDNSKPPYGISETQFDFKKNYDVGEVTNIPDCIIYPVQSKKTYSLDLPYSEMFRQFIEFCNKPTSTLLVMGYSFLDEHVNDIITNALSNPDFNLIVFSYSKKEDEWISPYLKGLIERSMEDSRISLFFGNFLGDFQYITSYLVPYPNSDNTEKVILDTIKRLKGEMENNV